MRMGRSAVGELDERVLSLVGRRLTGVRYFELRYDTPQPRWNRDPDFDSLDFGIELDTESGDAYWITWGNEFLTYALAIEINTQSDRSRMREWNVSMENRWLGLIGLQITGAQLYWDWQRIGSGELRWGPQDLRLTFENGATVFASALSIEPEHEPFGHMNNLTVIVDQDVARRYGVGPFAKIPTTSPPNSLAADW